MKKYKSVICAVAAACLLGLAALASTTFMTITHSLMNRRRLLRK